MEPCQLGVCLAEAGRRGHALRDGARSLPKDWRNDDERWQSAGVPARPPWATKPPLARQRLQQACDAQGPAAWGTGDRGYGDDRHRRVWLAERAKPRSAPSRARRRGGVAGSSPRSKRA